MRETGLEKEMELPGGVTVRYHRVARVDSVTNVGTYVEVASYTSQAKRLEEKAAVESGEWPDEGPFVRASTHELDYEPGMDADAAYAYLKGLPDYEGATDC